MLRLLERDPHGQRLRDLLARFRAQELALTTLLQELQEELEHAHRATTDQAHDGHPGPATLRSRCIELQADCDLVATELVHVRLAVAGACEELAEHDFRRFAAADQPLGTTA